MILPHTLLQNVAVSVLNLLYCFGKSLFIWLEILEHSPEEIFLALETLGKKTKRTVNIIIEIWLFIMFNSTSYFK